VTAALPASAPTSSSAALGPLCKPRWRFWHRSGERLGGWWQLTYGVLYWPVTAVFRVRYRDAEKLPYSGPIIVVANHVSHADPLVLAKLVLDRGRVPRFLAKDSLFRGRLLGGALRGMGHIAVDRNSVDAQQALGPAIKALQDGRVVIMYPEGTVTRDPEGWPMAGRLGTARLAVAVPDAPVIPIAQWGVQESIDLYRKRVRLIPRPRHTIVVGDPIDLSRFQPAAEPVSAVTLLRMTDVIMTELRQLVADVRGVPAPTGAFYKWRPNSRRAAADEAP
jgi:1-acyl-sn-glycerol-3-phosphate acyltransferase